MIEGCRARLPAAQPRRYANNPPCKFGFWAARLKRPRRETMVGTLASPSSPRHKSFAQHLLEIEQEAAKAASRCARGPLRACRRVQEAELGCAPSHRCRWAHSKTALAFEQPPTSFIGQFPSSVEPASHVPPGADTAAAGRASAAERDRERYACELRVLRRTIPELEEALASRDSLLQAPPAL